MEEGVDGPPTDDGPSPPSVMRGLCPAHSSGMTQEVEEGADSLFLTRESVGGGELAGGIRLFDWKDC